MLMVQELSISCGKTMQRTRK